MDKKELTERSRGREGDQGDNQQGGASAHVPGCTTEGRTDRGIAEVILTERDTPGHLGGRNRAAGRLPPRQRDQDRNPAQSWTRRALSVAPVNLPNVLALAMMLSHFLLRSGTSYEQSSTRTCGRPPVEPGTIPCSSKVLNP